MHYFRRISRIFSSHATPLKCGRTSSAGKEKAGIVHSVSGWTLGVQVKLWDPPRTRVIPERLICVFTTRRYANPRLALHLPYSFTTKPTSDVPLYDKPHTGYSCPTFWREGCHITLSYPSPALTQLCALLKTATSHLKTFLSYMN